MFTSELEAFKAQADELHRADREREQQRLLEITTLVTDVARFRDAAKDNIDKMFGELLERLVILEEAQSKLVSAMEPTSE